MAGNGAVGCPRIDEDDPPRGKGTPGIGCYSESPTMSPATWTAFSTSIPPDTNF